MDGDTLGNLAARHGTKGIPDKRNTPGGRRYSCSWTDDDGNFWLFGGMGVDSKSTYVTYNDLWKYDGTTWIWISGDSLPDGHGVYGVKGKGDTKNTPGARTVASCAYRAGIAYLYGGIGYDSEDFVSGLDDLWTWDGFKWTWVSGNKIGDQVPNRVLKGQPHPNNSPGNRRGAAVTIDSNGHFWLFGGSSAKATPHYNDDLWKWDGSMWTWVSGGSEGKEEGGIYGMKGQKKAFNKPGNRVFTKAWVSRDGDFMMFGGWGHTTSSLKGELNDVWKWDGAFWTYLSGDTIPYSSGHYTDLNSVDPKNSPSSRNHSFSWTDGKGNFWLFGGLGQGKKKPSSNPIGGYLSDLWKWNGSGWILINGSDQINEAISYGPQKGKSEKHNIGGRVNGVQWIDTYGNLWLYGGNGFDKDPTTTSIRAGLWRYKQDLYSNLQVFGNDSLIPHNDLTPRKEDHTHFGKASISNLPISRIYYIYSQGNDDLQLTGNTPVQLSKGGGSFKVISQPSTTLLAAGDSAAFTITFKPSKLGEQSAQVEILSNDTNKSPYIFKIDGLGGLPDVSLIDSIACSSVELLIKDHTAEFHTVIISDSGILELPVNGKNYNYSPNYLKASILKEKAKVLYQGTKLKLPITNLISNRRYQLLVVPGNGPASNTIYELDSADVLYFGTPPSRWKDSVGISPQKDSGVCEIDTLLFRAISPFSAEWMDGSAEDERLLEKADSYYFLTQDSVGCWIGSDTINYFFYTQPFIDSITGSPKPWCVGDSVSLYAHSPFPSKWIIGDDTTNNIEVYKDGWYKAVTELPPSCKSTDSIYVSFTPLPIVNFKQDTICSLGPEINLEYSSNAKSNIWAFHNQKSSDYQDFAIDSNGWLHLQSTTKGCRNQDSAWIIFKRLAKRAIPNAFTPNEDGLNEYWTFLHEDDSGTLKIFDRWGSRIYVGPPKWNGKIDGETVPVGAYQYIYLTEDEVISGKIHVVK